MAAVDDSLHAAEQRCNELLDHRDMSPTSDIGNVIKFLVRYSRCLHVRSPDSPLTAGPGSPRRARDTYVSSVMRKRVPTTAATAVTSSCDVEVVTIALLTSARDRHGRRLPDSAMLSSVMTRPHARGHCRESSLIRAQLPATSRIITRR
jgi:hypothetical protein